MGHSLVDHQLGTSTIVDLSASHSCLAGNICHIRARRIKIKSASKVQINRSHQWRVIDPWPQTDLSWFQRTNRILGHSWSRPTSSKVNHKFFYIKTLNPQFYFIFNPWKSIIDVVVVKLLIFRLIYIYWYPFWNLLRIYVIIIAIILFLFFYLF